MFTFITELITALKSLFSQELSHEPVLLTIQEQLLVTPTISSFVANARRFWRTSL